MTAADDTFDARLAHLRAVEAGQAVASEPETPELDPGASWAPVDLTSALDGTYTPPAPTVGERSDGVGLFYPGRLHIVAAEPEAAKTWFALMACITEMTRGHDAVFVDFEDEVGATVDRLLSLGCDAETIRRHFRYIHPETALTHGGRELLGQAADDATLVVLDGVTEAMSLHGKDPTANEDVAAFWRLIPRWVAERGPAVVMLDHVIKSTENRGRWAFGAQHKLAGLNGAQYGLERVHPFGVGMKGLSRITIAKDRPGQIRRHALAAGEGRQWFADLVLDGSALGPLQAEIKAPQERPEQFRPTVLMRKVSDAFTRAGGSIDSVRGVQTRVTGKKEHVAAALACLIDEGYVQITHGPRNARMHTLVKPFGEDLT